VGAELEFRFEWLCKGGDWGTEMRRKDDEESGPYCPVFSFSASADKVGRIRPGPPTCPPGGGATDTGRLRFF